MISRRRCYQVLCLGLISALLPQSGYGGLGVDMTATVINTTCQIGIEGDGAVYFSTVSPAYFADGITAESDYPGGKEFSIKLVSCPVSDDKIANVVFDFTPQSGILAPGNNQVFANELAADAGGVANVGVVIFTTNSPRTNVLNTDGTSRTVFNAPTYRDVNWTFYARMQKIISNKTVSTGELSTRVLVNVSYQ